MASLKNADCKTVLILDAQAYLLANFNAVDDVELNVVVSNISLNLTGELLVKLFGGPLAVEQEGSAGLNVLNHVILGDVGRIVAGNKVSLG